MIRRRKKIVRPRKIFDISRIEEESRLLKSYGLKNKKEIWKAKFFVEKLRKMAKNLLSSSETEKKNFIEKLKKDGLPVGSIDDIFSLEAKDILERRLQTIVFRKGLANTPKHARQLIVHRHILVGDRIINRPSFFVPKKLEEKIKKIQKQKNKK